MGALGKARAIGVVTAVAVVAVLLAAGCGDEERDATVLGDDAVRSVTLLTEGSDFTETVDATMSPDGESVFFTASGAEGAGVFRVPAAGGPTLAVARGEPFRSPVGIATDGARLYVADPGFAGRGAVLSVLLTGGDVSVVPGTEGRSPRGLEVVRQDGGEVLYFAGRDPADGAPAVFRIAAAGAPAPTVVTKGAPLFAPEAVTVTRTGDVYVSDRGSAAADGAVFRVTGGSATKVAGIRAPDLAGIALTLDESLLLVSSLSDGGTDQVLLVELATGRTGVASKVVGENRNGGGLHRARERDVFAWADVLRPGRVYRIEL